MTPRETWLAVGTRPGWDTSPSALISVVSPSLFFFFTTTENAGDAQAPSSTLPRYCPSGNLLLLGILVWRCLQSMVLLRLSYHTTLSSLGGSCHICCLMFCHLFQKSPPSCDPGLERCSSCTASSSSAKFGAAVVGAIGEIMARRDTSNG